MIRLADIQVDLDDRALVCRVRLGDQVLGALQKFLAMTPATAPIGPAKSIAIKTRDEAIANGYRNGASIKDLQKTHHCSQQRVYEAFAREGVEIRADTRLMLRTYSADVELEIAKEYLAGASTVMLADKFGGTQTSIAAALDRQNVPRRSASEAIKLKWAQRRAAGGAEPQKSEVKATAPAPPAKPPTAPQTAKPRATDATASRASPGDAKGQRDAEIKRLYVEEELSTGTIGAMFDLTPRAVADALGRQKVTLRTRSQAAQLLHRQRMERGDFKPKNHRPYVKPTPLDIPADAPRKTVRLADALKEREPPGGKVKGKEILKASLARKRRDDKLRKAPPLSAQEQQEAVKRFFEKGGQITEIESPKFQQTTKTAMGGKDGRK